MINLSRFSKMSFSELVSLPNNYIHEIYKLFVVDTLEREKRQLEEAKQQQQQNSQGNNTSTFAGNMIKDSKNVENLRAILAGGGAEGSELEDLLEELE